MPIARKRRAMTGFKIPKTFAKRCEATFEQKLPVSQSQNLFAIIRVPFFKRKAFVIVCFEMCRDGFCKRTIFLQLNTEIRKTVRKEDCLFIFKNTIKEFCHMDTMIRAP